MNKDNFNLIEEKEFSDHLTKKDTSIVNQSLLS